MSTYSIEIFAGAVIVLVIGVIIGISMYKTGKDEAKEAAKDRSSHLEER